MSSLQNEFSDDVTEISTCEKVFVVEVRVVSKEDNGKLSYCLVVAAADGNVQEVRRLLAAGAPVDARDGSGYTALHRAVMNIRTEVVKCLVYAGADVNVKNSARQTPLHYASYRHDLKVLLLLLGASASLNEKDDKGQTPLHWAIVACNNSAAKVLVLAGANMFISDNNGKPPFAIAQTLSLDLFKVL